MSGLPGSVPWGLASCMTKVKPHAMQLTGLRIYSQSLSEFVRQAFHVQLTLSVRKAMRVAVLEAGVVIS